MAAARFLVLAFLSTSLLTASPQETAPAQAPPLPRSASDWIGTPLTWADLRGRVALLNVWTFGCINCQRTLPWVREVRRLYAAKGLEVIGIHTPEFDSERKRSNVEAHVREEGLDWPHVLDNDYRYWKALDNQYWPTVYLVDRCGLIRSRFVGEIHSGQTSGTRAEKEIVSLLAEPGDCVER